MAVKTTSFKDSLWGGQFAPDLPGQFAPDWGGQLRPDKGGHIDRIFQYKQFTLNKLVDSCKIFSFVAIFFCNCKTELYITNLVKYHG